MEATTFLNHKFPGVDIRFDDDFEGMEKSVVINITNGSFGTTPSIIPLSLTRANHHLVIFIEDFRDILRDGSSKNLVKMSQHNLSPSLESILMEVKKAPGLQEAVDTLASLARDMPVTSIARLGQEWGVEELYQRMVSQNMTRWQMVKSMAHKFLETHPTTMTLFLDSLTSVNMRHVVASKLMANLQDSTDDLKDRIVSKNLTANEQIELAHSLGQRSLFNCLTQPQDASVVAISDQDALAICVNTWKNQATEMTCTQDLIECLMLAGLSTIATHIKENIDNNLSDHGLASLTNMSLKEKIGATALDVFLPVLTTLLTLGYMTLLFSDKTFNLLGFLLLIHWLPSGLLFSIHLYYNHQFFGSSLSISRSAMVFLILFQPVSSTILHIQYLLKRTSYTAGQAVESYKIRKVLQLADASVMMNNFTSLLVIIFTLHLANIGIIRVTEPTLFVISTISAILHLIKSIGNMTKNQIRENDSFMMNILEIFPVIGTLTLKIVSVVVLLSSSTTFSPIYGCLICLLALAANWQLEKKLVSGDNMEEEVKTPWIRAVESLIFPIIPELGSRRTAVLGVSLQLLVGDLTFAAAGFITTLWIGVSDGLYFTKNMAQALGVTSVGLVMYSSLALYMTSFGKTASTQQSDEDFEEPAGEASDTSTLLGNRLEPQNMNNRNKKALSTFLPVFLLLLLACPCPLLLYIFNTCPPFPYLPESTISCSSHLTVGSQCRLSCSPLHWSSSSLQSQCTWRGVWTVEDFTCRKQAGVLIGQAKLIVPGAHWVPGAEMYPAPANNSLLPGLPRDYTFGAAGYINGGLLYCGGVDSADPVLVPISSCFSLSSSALGWEESSSLLQV